MKDNKEAFEFQKKILDRRKLKQKKINSSEWISVNDKLPKEQKEVLVLAPECNIIGSVLIGRYFKPNKGFKESWTVYDFNESALDSKVTHWMELPKPPLKNH